MGSLNKLTGQFKKKKNPFIPSFFEDNKYVTDLKKKSFKEDKQIL